MHEFRRTLRGLVVLQLVCVLAAEVFVRGHEAQRVREVLVKLLFDFSEENRHVSKCFVRLERVQQTRIKRRYLNFSELHAGCPDQDIFVKDLCLLKQRKLLADVAHLAIGKRPGLFACFRYFRI